MFVSEDGLFLVSLLAVFLILFLMFVNGFDGHFCRITVEWI